MKIAFCTTCKGRTQHLEQTLPTNLLHNRDYADCVHVVLDYNSTDHLLDFIRANHMADIDSGRLLVYSYREPVPFQVAHAKNMAHRLGLLAGADILCNLDADNFTGEGFATYIANEFRGKDNIFLFAHMIQHGEDRLPRGINGRITVSKSAFLKVGGYDERFNTWSPDDKDFNLRLRRVGYKPVSTDRQYLNCIRHNDKIRFKHQSSHEEYGDESNETVDSCDTIVVNSGNIGCGIVYKLGEPNLCHLLEPLPTRIFGIGMQKTATTSLHHAFKILGYDSGHWNTAHWAKAIWDEMHAWGRSLTLERHYALSDLPITILYQELDRGYPGSKFILTTRSEEGWLRSVENHWSHDHNPYRAAWNTDPFSHKIHKAVYGQKGFDHDIFLARYRRHNYDVTQYFKDRPDDLLVLNMDLVQDWTDLCRFLQCPIPDAIYPRAFVTPKKEK